MIKLEKGLPSYLNPSLFNKWLDKFNAAIKAMFDFGPFNEDIYVIFSDKHKTKTAGSYSIDEIKKLIQSLWKANKEVEDILSGVNEYVDYLEIAEKLAGRIAELNDVSYDDVRDTIDGWFDQISYTYNVLGQYLFKGEIVLYVKNIEASLESNTLEQAFEEVFIHELFHAYHYRNDDTELLCRNDYTKEVVLESLASFFEVEYCKKYNIYNYYSIQKSWFMHPLFSYPYSGAKDVHDYSRFVNIFNESLVDADIALRNLVSLDEFYKIKNMVDIIYRSKDVFAPLTESGRKIYIVCQNKSFDEEKVGYLFAPDDSKHHLLKEANSGDIIIHTHNSKIVAFSVVTKPAYYSTDSFSRHLAGNYLETDYCILNNPIPLNLFTSKPGYPIKIGTIFYFKEFSNKLIFKEIVNEAIKTNVNPFLSLLSFYYKK